MSSDDTKSSSSPEFITRLIKTETEHGKLTNGYRIIRELGEGAYAQVKLCEQVETGKFYAMKKMSKRTLTKQREYGVGPLGRPKITTALDKVQREITLMTSCHHPSIVPLIAVIDDPDEDPLMLILEYADKGQIMDWDGNTLTYKSKLYPTSATGGLPESVIRRIMHDVVDGLEYLHEKRIIHRDIKPENLLMFSSGVTKICDFGVARSFTEQEDGFISDTHGTYHFFAPEMCTGEKFSGYKADIWSLGVTLFIMTFGSLPYTSKDNNPAELFENIGKKDLEFPDVPVSSDLRDLLNHILDKDPGKRYELAQIRQHRWMQAKDTETLTSTSPSTSTPSTSTPATSTSSAATTTPFPSAPKAPSTGSYIVVLHSHATDADIIALEHAITTSGGHIKHRYTTALRGVAGDMSHAQVKLLETHPLVQYVEADGVVTTQTDGPM